MKIPYTMLLLIILMSLTGCEEKASNKNPVPVENTTEIFTQASVEVKKNKQNTSTKNTDLVKNTSQNQTTKETFILTNRQNITHKLILSQKTLSVPTTQAALILFNLCSETSSACLAQISSFAHIQKKYGKKLFIVSVWIKNTARKTKNILSLQKKANYFLYNETNTTKSHLLLSKVFGSLQIDKNTKLPLSILYKNGDYYSHFEGAVPIEMITHDIQQAIQK